MTADGSDSLWLDLLRRDIAEDLAKHCGATSGALDPESIADWLLKSAGDGLTEARTVLGPESASSLEPYLTLIEVYQELARKTWYIADASAHEKGVPEDDRLLWEVIAAGVRDAYEASATCVGCWASGLDMPGKVVLRHLMDTHALLLLLLTNDRQRAQYLRGLRETRGDEHYAGAAREFGRVRPRSRTLIDRSAHVSVGLDESDLPLSVQADEVAELMRGVYSYLSDLTHAGPSFVDEMLLVNAPDAPGGQVKRTWAYGAPTGDGRLLIPHLVLVLHQFWWTVPAAVLRTGLLAPDSPDAVRLREGSAALRHVVLLGRFSRYLLQRSDTGDLPR